MRKTLASLAAVALMSSVPLFAAEMKGKISDAMCGAKHGKGEHAGTAASDRDCTEKCVKGGASYVFVSSGNVYKLEDPSKVVAAHAGQTVNLTGELKGDTITVAKIEMPKK